MSEALINGLAGAGGGIVSQLITYPLQIVNTRKQTERDPEKRKSQPGSIQQICQVIKEQGLGCLHRGLAPSLVGIAASQGVYYYFFRIFRTKVETSAIEKKSKGIGDGSVGMLSSLLVAALSGCVNVLLTNPIWVVVTRMQTHGKFPNGSLPAREPVQAENKAFLTTMEPLPFGTHDAIREVYDESGISGFWKGVIPTLIMVSNPSIQFMLYETMLKKLRKGNASSKAKDTGASAVEVFFLGALAKLGAISVTYPLVVIKSRLQAKEASGEDKRHHYKGTIDAFMKIISYEGLSGLYTGISTKIIQSVLAAAVLFMVKEEIVKSAGLLVSNNRATNGTKSMST